MEKILEEKEIIEKENEIKEKVKEIEKKATEIINNAELNNMVRNFINFKLFMAI